MAEGSRSFLFRLSMADSAILVALSTGGSFHGWLRELLHEEAKKRIKENDIKIAAFEGATADESGDDEGSLSRVSTLRRLVAKLRDENLVLYQAENE